MVGGSEVLRALVTALAPFLIEGSELYSEGLGSVPKLSIIQSVSVPDHSPTLRVTIDVEAPQLTIHLAGEIDLACADLLAAITQVEMTGITTIVVDLADLDFTDTSGLRALMSFRDAHVGDRDVRLVNSRPLVRRVFELVGHADALVA